MTVQEAAAALGRQDDILILTHRRPDGDTIGSAAGLCAALRRLGKRAFIHPNPDVTELNRVYAEPYWAPADFTPAYVVAVDIAARQLFHPGVVAGGDIICSDIQTSFQQRLPLHVTIAGDTGIRGSSPSILIDEVIDYLFFEFPAKIHHIMGDPQGSSHPPGVLHSGKAAAAAVFLL